MKTPAQLQKLHDLDQEMQAMLRSTDAIALGIKVTVAEMRSLGASWAWIAIGLGVSTQAAWERYGDLRASSGASSRDKVFEQTVKGTLSLWEGEDPQ